MSGGPLNGSGPQPDDPLRSCVELQAIAIVGERAILSEAEKPTRWAWQGIVEEGSVCMLAGAPGGGKTTLLFMLLVLRANPGGGDLFGARIAGGREGSYVVLVEGEHGAPSACRKLVASCRRMSVPTSALDRVIVLARKAVLVGDSRWREIERMVAAGVVSDIAIDTLARCAPGNGSDEGEQTAIMHTISQTIEAAPIAVERPGVWVNCHLRKGDPTGTVNDVSGSAARTAQCDAVAIVTPNFARGRMVSSTLSWAKVREAEDTPAPCTYVVRGNVLDVVDGKSKAEFSLTKDILLDWIQSHPGRSGSAVAKESRANKSNVLELLRELLSDGSIIRNKNGHFAMSVPKPVPAINWGTGSGTGHSGAVPVLEAVPGSPLKGEPVPEPEPRRRGVG